MASARAERTESLEGLHQLPHEQLIDQITSGLPARFARDLAKRLHITRDDMARLLRLHPRTLQRRLDGGVLNLVESERLWELSRLFFRAIEVLESEPAAVQWFKNPVQALGWATPLPYARTTVGLRKLANILGRIEDGVFS